MTCETVAAAVETPPPADLEEQDLAAALASSWALAVDRIRYAPKGFGSYHWVAETPGGRRYFVTVDDLETKPWLGADAESAFAGLQAAYDSASILHQHARLPFVVSAVPTLGGRTAERLTPRYSVAVFPFIDGEAWQWGDPIRSEDRDRLARQLAELHASTPVVAARARRRGVELPGRGALETALAELGQPWTGGPFSEPARSELAANAEAVHEALASFDDLSAGVANAAAELVITHGEPHPGNVIRTEGGMVLVDWDTVALAQPERDLWMLDDGSPNMLASYREATGKDVDPTAIALYRLAWVLEDIAAYTALLRADHARNQGTEKAWLALTSSVQWRASPPYGPAPSAERR